MEDDNLCDHMPPYHGVVKPAKIWRCDCGKNTMCPVCHFGHGSIPCDCDGVLKEVKGEEGR